MKLLIVNPKGVYFDGEVEYVIIDGDNGQLGILENHTPIVVGVNEGFVKRVKDNQEYFYMISGGIIEYKDNIINVIAQEVAEGPTLEQANKEFKKIRESAAYENKRKLMDFTELERDLAKNLKQIKAGDLK